MKVVIAPQSFKGSISALDAAKAMEEGVRRVVSDAETVLVPVADGGDGTLETLVEATTVKYVPPRSPAPSESRLWRSGARSATERPP